MKRRRIVLAMIGLVLAVVLVAVIVVARVWLLAREPLPIPATSGPVTGDNSLVETRQIMFTSNRDGNWDIYLMSLKDGSVTNLTNNSADDGFGSFSADGGAITFLSNRDGGVLNPYMMNADGSDQRPVANDLPTIMSVVGSGRLNWAYSYYGAGDSQKWVFVSLRDLNLEVYGGDASGDHNLTHNGAVDWFPAWSPDGTQIAFGSDRDGQQEIYVMQADGSNPRRLTNAPGDDLYAMWISSQRLLFMSDRDGLFANGQIGLYTLDPTAATPTATRLAADDTSVTYADPRIWPQDGTMLYVSNVLGHWDIYSADQVGRYARNLTQNHGDNLFPVWRPQPGK